MQLSKSRAGSMDSQGNCSDYYTNSNLLMELEQRVKQLNDELKEIVSQEARLKERADMLAQEIADNKVKKLKLEIELNKVSFQIDQKNLS